jgi:hypothetical protein
LYEVETIGVGSYDGSGDGFLSSLRRSLRRQKNQASASRATSARTPNTGPRIFARGGEEGGDDGWPELEVAAALSGDDADADADAEADEAVLDAAAEDEVACLLGRTTEPVLVGTTVPVVTVNRPFAKPTWATALPACTVNVPLAVSQLQCPRSTSELQHQVSSPHAIIDPSSSPRQKLPQISSSQLGCVQVPRLVVPMSADAASGSVTMQRLLEKQVQPVGQQRLIGLCRSHGCCVCAHMAPG